MLYYGEAFRKQILELGQRWADAELRCDADALGELLAHDFVFVGPRGCAIDRDRYLYARREGRLKHQSFILGDVRVRLYGGTAIAIGTQTQRGTYGDNDASGEFRVTQIAVQQAGRWTIAGMHLSQIGV